MGQLIHTLRQDFKLHFKEDIDTEYISIEAIKRYFKKPSRMRAF